MTESYPDDPKLVVLRSRFANSPSLFDNPDVTSDQIADAIWDVLMRTELPEESQAFLGGLFRSFYGRSPYHHCKVHHPPKGSKVQFAARIEVAKETWEMADAIDIAVAQGEKLEAKIAWAEQRYGLSRRQVFRRLKEWRSQRLKWKAMLVGEYKAASRTYLPDGYNVADDGRLTLA